MSAAAIAAAVEGGGAAAMTEATRAVLAMNFDGFDRWVGWCCNSRHSGGSHASGRGAFAAPKRRRSFVPLVQEPLISPLAAWIPTAGRSWSAW